MDNFLISETGFTASAIPHRGTKFLLSNGYCGYRGTLEEMSADQMVGITLAGLYDQRPGKWREPVNAPNPFLIAFTVNGQRLSALECQIEAHWQELDLKRGLHRRKTTFKDDGGPIATLVIERFLSLAQPHILSARVQLTCHRSGPVSCETSIDQRIWDINGPHLKDATTRSTDEVDVLAMKTCEEGKVVAVAAGNSPDGLFIPAEKAGSPTRTARFDAVEGQILAFDRVASIWTSEDTENSVGECALSEVREALECGFEKLLQQHTLAWADRWKNADVRIDGPAEDQLGLYYSLFQLMAAAPVHQPGLSIPARGLSGQVYKGGIFWDTEIFMLPFFMLSEPATARGLLKYRCATLDGARRKAAEFGYRGAFFAWESQETGDDACTDFNINDVFTGRPIRTYFRDKQIHISADISLAFWRYWEATGDDSLLRDGGLEVLLEVARFYRSHAYYKPDKQRFEFLDVLGPDEYHDRVHNNAFTNYMASFAIEKALFLLDYMERAYPDFTKELISRLAFDTDRKELAEMLPAIHLPSPCPETGLIEQFDGYFKLEDVLVDDVKQRVLNPVEYLGGHGPASTTQVIKQADVIMLMTLLPERFDIATQKANWEYYEPRTEHGSSLSACAYAIVAARLGMAGWAHPYFRKSAQIDIKGEGKQMLGDLYIGGIHSAANGGAWLSAIYGFAGLRSEADALILESRLPDLWHGIRFTIFWHGQRLTIGIKRDSTTVESDAANSIAVPVRFQEKEISIHPGNSISITPSRTKESMSIG